MRRFIRFLRFPILQSMIIERTTRSQNADSVHEETTTPLLYLSLFYLSGGIQRAQPDEVVLKLIYILPLAIFINPVLS